MKEKGSAKSLLEMNCGEIEKIVRQRENDKDSLVSQIQFGKLRKHCLHCKECEEKAREIGLLIS